MSNKFYYKKDGTFKLMQLTDVHYNTDSPEDHRTVALMREMIAAEKPDLIMVTGDLFGSENVLDLVDKAIAPIVEAGVPWTFTFGNHDVEYGSSKRELFSVLQQKPGFVGYHDAAAGGGYGNHVLELCNGQGAPEWLIVGMDSGDYLENKNVGGYGYVTRAQIQWYCDKMAEYEQKNDRFSAMVFMHVALQEHAEVWKYEVCYGAKRDGVGHSRLNSGFFCAMQEAGHTKGVFVGHDHANDYWGWLYGIALGYGRVTGFGTYGTTDHHRGCRIFEFHEGNTEKFDTHVRIEHNTVIGDPWIQNPIMKRDEG